MPRPTPKPPKRNSPVQSQTEVVSPIWLLKAVAITVVAALVCAYLTLCLLFYQGQWQLVLHPTRTSVAPASISGVPYALIHFGPDESATPQLTGWWIPSALDGRYAHLTILFLPGSDGSLVDSLPTLASLHKLGINIFAFDYRGYGQSAPARPSQQSMSHDVDSAWQYLSTSRGLHSRQIIPYGIGVGASLATQLTLAQTGVPALILDGPRADLFEVARQDSRAKLVPVSLLFHNTFPLAVPLSALKTPKFLLSRSSSPDQSFRDAADPKLSVELPSPSEFLYNQSLMRFLDQYLPAVSPPQLVPSSAPTP